MAAYTGVGERIRDRMVALGFVRADGQPDVQRFCWDFRYDRTLIYAWLADKATPFKDLIRLARDLQVSVEWLLTGREREAAGKADRRQGRRPTVGSLLLALSVASASVCAWPSGGGAVAEAATLPAVYLVEKMPLIGRWLRILLAWRVQVHWCPA